MLENDDKVLSFKSLVDKDAEYEIKNAINDAVREKEELLKKGQDELLRYSFKKISAESKKIKLENTKRVSQKRYDSKRSILSARNKLTEEFFGGIIAKLLDFTKQDSYKKYLPELFGRIDSELPFYDGVVAYLKEGEDDSAVRKKYPVLKIEKSHNIKIGGAAFYYPQQQKYIDATFDKALENEKTVFVRKTELQL